MCGIVGIFNYARQAAVGEQVLERMRDAMVSRGPDGAGIWISPDRKLGLGHRRLSIIDLSDSASQPMCNEDGSIWVTFNGEIYNHLRLRTELQAAGHRFKTDHSDTEVLVHGFEQWGIDGLAERIAGDYAFAIWNCADRSLHLVRDRIGVKPLYFTVRDGFAAFASEIKALLKHPEVRAEIDPSAMYHYLSFLATPAPLTMFSGIYKLPAGYRLTIDSHGKLHSKRYWDAVPGKGINPAEVRGMNDATLEDFYVDGIRDRLKASVAKRMMSDVPFGVFLSGGIDSSTNVALMAELMNRPVNTFTVGFKDHTHLNELEHAEQVAKRFSTNHHEVLIDEADMIGYLDQLIHSQDEPLADWVCIPLYFVSKLARDSGTTVVQVGEGADEQFCGYASYISYLNLYRRYWSPFRKYLPGIAQSAIAGVAGAVGRFRPSLQMYADVVDRATRNREHFWSGAMVFWDVLKHQLVDDATLPAGGVTGALNGTDLLPASYLLHDSFNIVRSFFEPFDAANPDSDVLTRMIYSEFKLRLPELLLMRVDKIGMSSSIEARLPFLDHELVEFSMDIPMRFKIRNNQAKYLLKKAVRGWIPDAIIDRKKMGFGAPMTQWLRGAFGRRVEADLMRSPLLANGWLRRDYVRALCRDHRDGRHDNGLYIWTLFNLVAWHDYWVTGSGRTS